MRVEHIRIGALLAVGLLTACRAADETEDSDPAAIGVDEPITIQAIGLSTPESVLHDPVADVYLISNVNGSPLAEDGNGFISRVAPTGDLISLKWIDGEAEGVTLHAPKGMAIVGDTLYVTDITVVRMFDRQTGAPLGHIAVEGATFLNDLSAGPDGTVYVTDSGLAAGEAGFVPTGTDGVHRLTGGTAERIVAGEELARPNGTAVADGRLWVVSFGAPHLYAIEDGEMGEPIRLPDQGLDGLIITPSGTFLVSSWNAQAIYAGTPDGTFEAVVTDVEAPADIGYDAQRNRVLIPLFMGDAVIIRELDEIPDSYR